MTLNDLACFSFWFIAALGFYGYLGYPMLVSVLSWFIRSDPMLPTQNASSTNDANSMGASNVSILVAAYNEEDNITAKLDSLCNQHYQLNNIEILVLNDGSDDNTANLVTSYIAAQCDQPSSIDAPSIRLLDLPRGGKAAALNAGADAAQHDILVFSDADNHWQADTLTQLLAPFSVNQVGAVSGRLTIEGEYQNLGLGDRLYRNYEAYIRSCETQLGSAVSADGGIFAIRKALFDPVPPDVTDDFFISTGAVEKGFSLVYQSSALAFDQGVETAGSQYRRRIRVTVRGMRSLWRRRRLLNPFQYGIYAICLISHKLIRRFVPFFAMLLLPLNIAIVTSHTMESGFSVFYSVTLISQIVFYLSAIAGLVDAGKRLPKPFTMAGFLLLSSFALGMGVFRFLIGERFTQWSPQSNR
ncbi:MAG: glycosyltransferase [Pseudomonadales bacterium]|nr:glycosyltransferase [Pseudomonadales bacterium]